MQEIKVTSGSKISLSVKVSSEAIFTTSVKLNNSIIRQSRTTKFTTVVGEADVVIGDTLAGFTSFFVNTGNIDAVKNNTVLEYTVKYGDQTIVLPVIFTKVSECYFTGSFVGTIKKP